MWKEALFRDVILPASSYVCVCVCVSHSRSAEALGCRAKVPRCCVCVCVCLTFDINIVKFVFIVHFLLNSECGLVFKWRKEH